MQIHNLVYGLRLNGKREKGYWYRIFEKFFSKRAFFE